MISRHSTEKPCDTGGHHSLEPEDGETVSHHGSPLQFAKPCSSVSVKVMNYPSNAFFFFPIPCPPFLKKTHKINFMINKQRSFLKSDVEGEVSGPRWVAARLASSGARLSSQRPRQVGADVSARQTTSTKRERQCKSCVPQR